MHGHVSIENAVWNCIFIFSTMITAPQFRSLQPSLEVWRILSENKVRTQKYSNTVRAKRAFLHLLPVSLHFSSVSFSPLSPISVPVPLPALEYLCVHALIETHIDGNDNNNNVGENNRIISRVHK